MLDRLSRSAIIGGGRDERPDVDVLIVGSGFAGLAMAVALKRAGRDNFLIIEKGSELGGTWRDNSYPGAACDIAAHLYSLSFAPKADWSRVFATQTELLEYSREVAAQFKLREKMRFETEMVRADWDDANAIWRVATQTGDVVTARILVSGTGPLHVPSIPQIKGIETFEGETFHSARWREDFNLQGKKIAVVGTGASAIQFVPQIAPLTGQVHLFQRTAPWILPKGDKPYSRVAKWAFANIPGCRAAYRAWLYAVHEFRALLFNGNMVFVNKAESIARQHIAKQISDPALRARLTPDYRIGCKRVLISDDYYPALNRGNVELVNDAIVEVRPHSIVTRDGREREVDAIIWGTGFDVAKAMRRLQICGRGGGGLQDVWRDRIESYYGIAVAGFPNFFMLLGPNTTLGHNSVVIMIEAQVAFIMSALQKMDADGIAAAAVRAKTQGAFYDDIQHRLQHTMWQAGGCSSWYHDDSGNNVAIWPGFSFDYIMRTRQADLANFEIVARHTEAADSDRGVSARA